MRCEVPTLAASSVSAAVTNCIRRDTSPQVRSHPQYTENIFGKLLNLLNDVYINI